LNIFIYIAFYVSVWRVHIQRKNNILYILILVWHTHIYLYMALTMTIDYLHGKWNLMWNNTTRQRTEKKERLEIIIIIIIKLLQLCVGVWERTERMRVEEENKRSNTISNMYVYMSCLLDIQWRRAFFSLYSLPVYL
jgi:uncharacterized membrane protein YidH (DUF202 family)